MIALIQRVLQANVTVGGRTTGAIGRGLLVLLCAERGDDTATGERLLAKLLKLRVFADPAGKMNLSVQDVQGGLLIVSQFTLAADVWSGNRPSFGAAAPPELGRALYEHVVARARALHPTVATGEFGADMQVQLVNDGPVTIPMRVAPVSLAG
ncbi:D-tyrosyl-tRNA(Tyr) deacylase [Comamonas serinivorans]|uniref:D-aminoacyl-tRNA deacylase n=1 Tax=Comamonas serinivorans TaxID=1082851 RepID=A0A1Y0ESS7_9BURK|nr:D-aminoacyl-tRNA deacylase [Comamonas serinivorans]ARU06349.1 D-tyrosyl-tRNA(Tyr) deacylase [Comamonas serinivorans]